eukprot:scaffold105765_cov17-Tisochrysis_lutea.AAC.1
MHTAGCVQRQWLDGYSGWPGGKHPREHPPGEKQQSDVKVRVCDFGGRFSATCKHRLRCHDHLANEPHGPI